MSNAVEKTKVLVVDIEMAMLNVLKNFSDQQQYNSRCYFDPAEACTALAHRKYQGETDYSCVLLGWPDGSIRIMRDLLDSLESSDHRDLPLVILCHEVTADIDKLIERRANTHIVRWKQYQETADLIAQFTKPDNQIASAAVSSVKTQQRDVTSGIVRSGPIKALLLDNTPAVSTPLRELMESSGYRVTMAGSAEDARKALRSAEYDLVLTDFYLRGEGGEDFCRFVQSCEDFPGSRPVCVVVCSKHTDAIVKRSLAVGAIACFNKDESTDILFARIGALVAALPKAAGSSIAAQTTTNEMLELADDPALVIDQQGLIAGLNRKARQLLDDINRRDLTGRSFAQTICSARIDVESKNTAKFRTSSGSDIAVTYMAQQISNGDSTGILLTFNPQPVRVSLDEKGSSRIVVGDDDDSSSVVETGSAEQQSLASAIATVRKNQPPQEIVERDVSAGQKDLATFTGMLKRVARVPEKDVSYSVLLLDIQLIAATNDRLSVGDSEPMLGIVSRSLASLYTQDHSLTYLGHGQFMYLLSVADQQESLVLTRKLLQLVPQMVKYLSNMTLVSHATLLQLSAESSLDAAQIIKKCRRGVARTRLDKRDNCALVLPVKKYLRAKSSHRETAQSEEAIAD